MVCPKCGKKVSKEDYNCIYCGVQLKSTDPSAKKKPKPKHDKSGSDKTEKTKIKGLFAKKKKPGADSQPAPSDGTEGSLHEHRHRETALSDKFKTLKIAVIGVLAAVVVVLVIILLHSLASKKGERFSQQASEYIGRSVGDLNKESELFYSDTTDNYGINNTISYDCIGESTDTVTVQGIKFPEWAVTLKLSEAKFITDVTYTDFSLLKHDIRGEKRSEQISLERFHDGDKQSAVLREIDLTPYSITYSQNGTVTYTYKYYYKRDNGDEQAVLLRAVFTENGKYRYSTAELIFPANMG